MTNKKYKFNGYYAVVDDNDNIYYESESYYDVLCYFMDIDGENTYLTKEMELHSDGIVEDNFTRFKPVAIDL